MRTRLLDARKFDALTLSETPKSFPLYARKKHEKNIAGIGRDSPVSFVLFEPPNVTALADAHQRLQ
jgi:hypothetical protein